MLTNRAAIQRIGAAWHRTERIGAMLLILLLPPLTAMVTATSTYAQAITMNNIVVTQASASSALTISWQTNVATTGVVVYGPTAAGLAPNAQQPLGYSKFQRRLQQALDTTSAKSASTGTAHSISIPASRFAQNTRVYYTIQSTLPNGSLSTTTAIYSLMTAAVGVTAPVVTAPVVAAGPAPVPAPTPAPTATVPSKPITSPVVTAPTPTPTTPPTGQASPLGYLDVIAADSHAYGWSYDPDASSQSNTVQIYVDGPAGSTAGIFGGQANADRPRPDVNKVRSVSGNHGFDWPIPARFLDGKSHSLYVYGVDLTGNANRALNGSPMVFIPAGSTPLALTPTPTAPPAPTPIAPTPVAAPTPIAGKGTAAVVSLSSDPAGQGPGFARAHWTGSKMLVFFGYSHNSTANNSVRAFDPVTNTWEYLWPNSNGADGLQNRDNHASLYVPRLDELWVWGGSGLENYGKAIGNESALAFCGGRFSVSQKRWVAKGLTSDCYAPFSSVVANFGGFRPDPAMAWSSQLDMGVQFGGSDNGVYDEQWIIEPNPAGPQPYRMSQFHGPRPPARTQAMNLMVAGGTNFYLLGGYTGQANGQYFFVRDFWKFDGINRTWTRLADPPAVGYQAAVTFDSDKNAVIAWVDHKIYVYDLSSNQWSDHTPASLPCVGNQVGVYSPTAKMHLFEGGNRCADGGSVGPQVYAISLGTSGSVITPAPPPSSVAVGTSSSSTTPVTPPSSASGRLPAGFLDSIASDGTIRGWSYDPDVSSQSNDVEIYIDGGKGSGTRLSTVTTNQLRSDVNAAFGISGNHGFTFTIPTNLRDGKSHQYYIYGIDKTGNGDFPLTNSPKSFTMGTSVTPTTSVIPPPAPVPTPAPAATSPVSPPPVAGWLNIPLRTWIGRPLPPYSPDVRTQKIGDVGFGPGGPSGAGQSKHQRIFFNTENKRLYFYSGDYSGPPFGGSFRTDTFSYDITAGDLGDYKNWRLEWPYCGLSNQISPIHTDETGFTWDSTRKKFWLMSGFSSAAEDSIAGCRNAGISGIYYGINGGNPGNAQFPGTTILRFDPATNRWDAPAGFTPLPRQSNHAIYNPTTDEIIQFSSQGVASGANHLNLTTGAWTNFGMVCASGELTSAAGSGGCAAGTHYINDHLLEHEQPVLDVANQQIYIIDAAHKLDTPKNQRYRLFRYDVATHGIRDLGWIPLPDADLGANPGFCSLANAFDDIGCTSFPYYAQPRDSTMLAYDPINKVVLWPASSNTGRPILMIYHPDSKTWEIDPMVRDNPNEVIFGSNGTFIPELNALVIYGGFSGVGSNLAVAPANNFWLYRYGNGK